MTHSAVGTTAAGYTVYHWHAITEVSDMAYSVPILAIGFTMLPHRHAHLVLQR